MEGGKRKQQQRAKTIEKKKQRSALRYQKRTDEHTQDMEDQRNGTLYGPGVALDKEIQKAVQDALSSERRNPPYISPELRRCKYYHPQFCTVLGHTTCASKECKMKGV